MNALPLPGYDSWKLASPYDEPALTVAELREKLAAGLRDRKEKSSRLAYMALVMGDDLEAAFADWCANTDPVNVEEAAQELGL